MKKIGSIGVSPYRKYPPQKYLQGNPMVLHDLTSSVDGSTSEFILNPIPANDNVIVIVDGTTRLEGITEDYIIENNTIKFSYTLEDSETLQALYSEA